MTPEMSIGCAYTDLEFCPDLTLWAIWDDPCRRASRWRGRSEPAASLGPGKARPSPAPANVAGLSGVSKGK